MAPIHAILKIGMRRTVTHGIALAATIGLVLAGGTLLGAPADMDITVSARAIEPGEALLVTIPTPPKATDVRVQAFGREIRAFQIDAVTWQAVVGIDLDDKPGDVTIEARARVDDTRIIAKTTLTVRPHEFPTRRLTVDEQYVNPPEATMERIAKEQKELEAIWADSAQTRLWSGAFERPVPQENNSAFGSRSVFNDQPRSPHSGADFLSPAGTPIHAPNAGRIVLAKELYFTGNTVIIDHGLGMFSLMAHLSAIDVHEHDTVKTGQLLGAVGATGRVTGAHLHWAIRINGARVDPMSVLTVLGPG
jgi:murein DD-endopeptidase MepM/ murein hydrolase activator NlpD